ncbi:ribbon-helix-helix domain-containing protein [Tsukamurella pulmonis]|uniref:ribbon-helix-helix domain-containing protein n=1 Tax=Tsukamurella pulmonis TaxID=47312 RepID=UPI000A5081D2|nr:ribbon-helix-helix domain-containing protein [Tsukamurella pulmonis]
MTDVEQRIMRLSIPVPVIREMDAVILKGIGGYSTRAEFIIDAIQERVLELSSQGTVDAGPPETDPSNPPLARERQLDDQTPNDSITHAPLLATTSLVAPPSGYTVHEADNLSRPASRPLFGLHNRDYPSLWALSKLASLTVRGPIAIDYYLNEIVGLAWEYGEKLVALENATGIKCTALFPTNPEKRKQAETGFRSFAIGDYRRAGSSYATEGPLFEWNAVGIVLNRSEGLEIGLTASGWQLLNIVAGTTVAEPHPAIMSLRFFKHLSEYAPGDLQGFIEIIHAIGEDGASRQTVLDHVSRSWPGWTQSEVSTNCAGYIARGREWGLIQPKQTRSRYHLTSLGIEYANGEAK